MSTIIIGFLVFIFLVAVGIGLFLFFYNKKTLCTDTNCNTCDTNSLKCDTKGCKTGYYNTDGICKPNKPCSSNCIDCNSTTGTCASCNSGYYIDGVGCSPNKTCNTNCSVCDSTTGTCTTKDCIYKDEKGCHVCDIGFYNKNGVCTNINIENCEIGNSRKCIECKKGYYTNPHLQANGIHTGGNCIACQLTENCNECNSVGCVGCDKGYTLDDAISNKKCVSCELTENCKMCNKQGCSVCDEGYIRKKKEPITDENEQFYCEQAFVQVLNDATFKKRIYDTNKRCSDDNDQEYLAQRFQAGKPYPLGGNWENSGWCVNKYPDHTIYKPESSNKFSKYTSNKETTFNHITNTYENVFTLPCDEGWDPVSKYGLPDPADGEIGVGTGAVAKNDYTTNYHDMLYCKKKL